MNSKIAIKLRIKDTKKDRIYAKEIENVFTEKEISAIVKEQKNMSIPVYLCVHAN